MDERGQGAYQVGAGEEPIFVTADGRERRRARWLGRALALALCTWTTAVLAGGTGFTSLPPLPGLPAHVAARVAPPASPATTFVKFKPNTGRGRDRRA